MKSLRRPLLLVLLCPFVPHGWGGILKVGSGQPFLTIQSAVDAASPGDTIEVRPGTYPENVVVNKSPLTLLGAKSSVTARGRILGGSPDPAMESVVAPASGSAVTLASANGVIQISGFSLRGIPGAASGIISAVVPMADGLTISNNDVTVSSSAAEGASLRLSSACADVTVQGNVFTGNAFSTAVVELTETGAFAGFEFLENDVIRSSAAASPEFSGLRVRGNRNMGASFSRIPTLQGNHFSGHGIGFDGGPRSLDLALVADNEFSNNVDGTVAGPRDSIFEGNKWQDNSRSGLRLSSGGETVLPAFGAMRSTIQENTFLNNGTTAHPSGYGALVLEDEPGGHQGTNLISRNKISGTIGLQNLELSGVVDARKNYWGAASGPGGLGSGSGAAIGGSGAVNFSPFCSDETLLQLRLQAGSVTGTLNLNAGETLSSPNVTMAPASSVSLVNGASLATSELSMQAGAHLELHESTAKIGKLTQASGAVVNVLNSDLSLDPLGVGEVHTISGSFSFFNCLGSMHVHADTTFSGAALGLASDIHVDPGVTLLVLGSLSLDGCTVDGPGTFYLLSDYSAQLDLRRCRLLNLQITLSGGNVRITDNFLDHTVVTAFSTVNGAAIYHNVVNASSLINLLPGATATTTREGWGNVSSSSQVQNALTLNFRVPPDPTRTLDSSGNLFVQPGDTIFTGMDISQLNSKIQAVESLLGFSTDYLDADLLSLPPEWDNKLYSLADETATLGRFNSAIGLSFAMPDRDGTTQPGEVCQLKMIAKLLEGRTQVFFRNKSALDLSLIDTRLTTSTGGNPSFLNSPFTQNSATLTIDGTAPVFTATHSVVQMKGGIPVDVTLFGNYARQGSLAVIFETADALAGIDDSDVSVRMTGLTGVVPGSQIAKTSIVSGGESFTRYTFQLDITASVANGPYNVQAVVMDRSGNAATLPLGTLEVLKNQLSVTVEPQGLVSTPLTRSVTFVATDSAGAILSTWNVPVNFTGGQGIALLTEVPVATVNLSAKMAWTLRTRLPATFDSLGQGSVGFVGVGGRLRGGDFTGDNIVNLTDYSMLRDAFPSLNSATDITGDGITNLTDYSVLGANWVTAGDLP